MSFLLRSRPFVRKAFPRQGAALCRTLSPFQQQRTITLASEWLPDDDKAQPNKDVFVFLHGLLGNRRNVMTLAKTLCSRMGRRGLLLDLRGHGESQLEDGGSSKAGPTTLSDCAADVYETLVPYAAELTQVRWTLVGHSLGGRVSILYALQQAQQQQQSNPQSPQLLPQNIWLLDTVPGALDASVRRVIQVALDLEKGALPLPKTRSALVESLVQDQGLSTGVAQWLASSFRLKSQTFSFDLQVAQEILLDFDEAAFMDWIHAEPVPVDLVRGGANPAWASAAGHVEDLEEWHEQAEREFRLHTLPAAGHWLHMDDLQGLVDIIAKVQADMDTRM